MSFTMKDFAQDDEVAGGRVETANLAKLALVTQSRKIDRNRDKG